MLPALTEVPSRKHQCSTCNKTYSTNSHLRRHEAIHNQERRLTCPSCHAQFSRRDVARQHVKRCVVGGNEVIFPTMKRGKKRVACDRCAQCKLSCDTHTPCQRCQTNGTKCIYQQSDLGAHPTPYIQGDSFYSLPVVPATDTSSNFERGRISIDFLLNFTNPVLNGPSVAIATDADQRDVAEVEFGDSSRQHDLRDNYSASQTPFWSLEDSFSELFDVSTIGIGEDCAFSQYDFQSELPKKPQLEARVSDIIYQLSATHDSILRHKPDTEAHFDAQLAAVVFTPDNLESCIRAYFHHFHGHLPIIHRPTFDSETTSLPLLIAVFLFGSMSPTQSHVAVPARRFSDVAEAFIFDQAIFEHALGGSHEALDLHDEIETLQAALLLLMVQNNTNNLTTRRRIRLQRIPRLVSAVRALRLFEYKRQGFRKDTTACRWQTFICDEVRIRMAVWMFMIDSTLAVFFNSPPQVVLSEMIGDQPCGEEIFDARTASDFEALAFMEFAEPQAFSLPSFVSLFLSDSVPGPCIPVRMHTTSANMLMAICALQSAAITSRLSLLAPATVEALLRAMDKWKSLWEVIIKEEPNNLRQSGFVRHAEGVWWLTKALVEVGRSGDLSCRYMHPSPSDSAEDLHRFIQTYKDKV
ncbi:hypothetical protein T440DRAFT_60675 [Plenodomus tracheiphilus IPT5]|uniref:C2H2 finger domain protein n=1 Tax=Plenodomus tracheiphilus IPT5 TaxID=1408161 RepID=A0A6A7AM23_9PLEO|nr:hypothetical protein T440DRAFT_60675 [Plenodomus tracheiphilus IPT5]